MRWITAIAVAASASTLWGQATQPAGSADVKPLSATVMAVTGNVSYARSQADGAAGAWQEAKVGDAYPAGTRIRTRPRSQITLRFGDDTVAVIERMTLASIEDFHASSDTKTVRLGLGHGAIRAGVAETTLRSDMTIDTPTATLSKRGTIGFRLEYEPVTGRIRASLDTDGLVNLLLREAQQSADIRPGQYVTNALMNWILTSKFDRYVPLVDAFGLTGAEELFNAMRAGGRGVLEPGGGSGTEGFGAGRGQADFLRGQQGGPGFIPILPGGEGGPISRPEGNFGTGPRRD